MTAAAIAVHDPRPATPPDFAGGEPVTIARVIGSEWIKFRTLRSTIAVLVAAMFGLLGIAMLIAFNTRHLSSSLQPDDIVASSTMQGRYLAQLLVGALGVLFVSGEFSTGMIRSTFAAVPTRMPVLIAKAVVFVAVVLTTMIVMSLIAFVCAQALIAHYRAGYSLADPGVLRVVIGNGVYLTLVGVIGSALGWIVRSTPGSLVAYFGTILVVPVLFGSVLGTWGKNIAQFLPSTAGESFVDTLRQPHTLAPWIGLGVLTLWSVGAMVVAAIELRRRDA
jgi:ABC-2 type transport system permease protein